MKKIKFDSQNVTSDWSTRWIQLNDGNISIQHGTIILTATDIEGVLDGVCQIFVSNDNDSNTGVKVNEVAITTTPFELVTTITSPIQFIAFDIRLNSITKITNIELDGIFTQEEMR